MEVRGRVRATDSTLIAPGRTLPANVTLHYGSPRNRVRVVDKDGNFFVLTPSATTKATQAFAKVLTRFRLAAAKVRAELVRPKLEKLPADLESAGAVIIEEHNRYLFDTIIYKMPGAAFVLRIASPGRKPFDRLLRTRKDTLLLDYRDFLADNQDFSKILFSLHYKKGTDDQLVVARIRPYFDQTDQLPTLLEESVGYVSRQKASKTQIFKACFGQVRVAFGKPASLSFREQFDHFYNYQPVGGRPLLEHFGTGALLWSPVTARHAVLSGSEILRDTGFTLLSYAPVAGVQSVTNSCTAWASAYGAATINYRVTHGNKPWAYAPELIYNRQISDGCSKDGRGLLVSTALNFMRDTGNLLKYDTLFHCDQRFSRQDVSLAGVNRISSFKPLFQVPDDELNQDDIKSIKLQLAAKKAVILVMYLPVNKDPSTGRVRTSSFDSLRDTRSGIWRPRPDEYTDIEDRDDHKTHAMCIIGYHDKLEGGCFEVLNSYGSGFGHFGRLYINYGDLRKFGAEAYVIDR